MNFASVKNKFLVFAALASVSVLGFQNCGQNMTAVGSGDSSQASNLSNGVTLSACIASGCPQDKSYIQLQIANNNPISFTINGSTVSETAVDVAGYCNAGGYPGSRIYYSIQDLAGNVIVPNTPTTSTCSALGRFQFPVNVGGLNSTNNYQLNVVLRGVDSTGVEFDNSLGLNKRQVGLSPTTGI